MEALFHFLEYIGTESLGVFWLPVAIWTAVALVVHTTLKALDTKIQIAYHYHIRVALLWGLGAGVFSSAFFSLMPSSSTEASTDAISFIVIQNPITVTASVPSTSVPWAEPALWFGILTAIIIILAAGALVKLGINFMSLRLLAKRLTSQTSDYISKLNTTNKHLLLKYKDSIAVTFSEDVEVPCTFGWYRKRIILPEHFLGDKEKLNMALLHELTHIQNNDYLLNTTVQSIKALFVFHPLVHKLAAGIEEYREMYCDQYVLQDAGISQKNYAQLLFELSPKSVFKTSAAVNMAVRFSTLKKRIQTMKTPTPNFPSLKWSMSLMLIFSLMITGLMSCSDIEEGGITQSEVEDTQAQMNQAPDDQEPLIVLNGEEMDRNSTIMARLKTKYISSVDVLKGKKALQEYGDKGRNGVIKITVSDKEKALEDLRTDEEMAAMEERRQKGIKADDSEEIYVAVEQEPELEGGLRSIQKNVEYPQSCRQAGIEGRVTLSFVVTKEGAVENVEVLKGIGSSCDEAAVEAVREHAKFEPGMQRGKPVNVRYSLPIFFKLAQNAKSNDKSEMSSNTLENDNSDIQLSQLTVVGYQ